MPGLALAALILGHTLAANAGTICRDIPTQLDERAARDAFGADDAAAFLDARHKLEADLNAVCGGPNARLFRQRVRRIELRMAAGAAEPTAYLKDRALVVEFFGGPFHSARFRQRVGAVLRGETQDNDD